MISPSLYPNIQRAMGPLKDTHLYKIASTLFTNLRANGPIKISSSLSLTLHVPVISPIRWPHSLWGLFASFLSSWNGMAGKEVEDLFPLTLLIWFDLISFPLHSLFFPIEALWLLDSLHFTVTAWPDAICGVCLRCEDLLAVG